jgi:hypothetical protein
MYILLEVFESSNFCCFSSLSVPVWFGIIYIFQVIHYKYCSTDLIPQLLEVGKTMQMSEFICSKRISEMRILQRQYLYNKKEDSMRK